MKINKAVYLVLAAVIVVTAGAIFSFYSNRKLSAQPSISKSPSQSPTLANPASAYCREQGGRSQIITAADGSQSGDCVFSDGSKCDEWAFFRHECQKAGQGNFSEQGKYLVIDGRPVFSYQEPGKPAVRLDIFFAVASICDFGKGEGKCNVHELESGDKVSIEGTKTESGLAIVKMKKM